MKESGDSWPLWLLAIEQFVDWILPWLLIPLTFVILLEFVPLGKVYHSQIVIVDSVIVSFFVIDLIFKYARSRSTGSFIKVHWLDILAVLPYYTMFRVFTSLKGIVLGGEQVNRLLHEAVVIREVKLISEAERVARFSREARVIRALSRGFRGVAMIDEQDGGAREREVTLSFRRRLKTQLLRLKLRYLASFVHIGKTSLGRSERRKRAREEKFGKKRKKV